MHFALTARIGFVRRGELMQHIAYQESEVVLISP
jgi:hypothetical protein